MANDKQMEFGAPALPGISRRTALTGAAALLAVGTAATPASAKVGPAVRFMQKISKDFFAAAHAKTPASFLRAIKRHADIPAISEYSLGDYSTKLEPGLHPRLNRGVAEFMARFFASQAEVYPVTRAEINGERPYSKDEVIVATRIYLETGTSYAVDWLLAERDTNFKIRDVRILGFWLSPFQRSLFVRYIAENGGDVKALLSALRV
jgi:ABC-type transporter MlaC component